MAIPEKIGRYLIKSELGRGGMATVYRAFDPSFDREVAIKVLPREMLHDPQFRSRFEREIKMVAALEHPSIVPVYDVGDDDGQPYFVMRYMTGGSLSNAIENDRFSLQDTARIVEKIAQGLAYSHKKGIVHRDLKPDNILFDSNGDPFISDFGVAKLTEASGGLTGSGVIGTPAYMSPEQAQGNDIDGRSDVYGLGVIVYQMLSGQQPYSADTPMGVVVKHITEPVPEILNLIPDLAPEVDNIVKTAMAKDKTMRYATTLDLAKALNMVAFGNEGSLSFGTNSGAGSGTMSGSGAIPAGGTIAGTAPSTPGASGSGTDKKGFSIAGTGLIIGVAVIVVAIIGFFLMRNLLFATGTPTEVAATEAPNLITDAPTEPAASAFAPACSANTTVQGPEMQPGSPFCAQKASYAGLKIPEGATLEVISPEGKCDVVRVKDGIQEIQCTGPFFSDIVIKSCNPPPVLSNEDLNKCAAGSTFNSQNQCCMNVAPKDAAGCSEVTIKMKQCN